VWFTGVLGNKYQAGIISTLKSSAKVLCPHHKGLQEEQIVISTLPSAVYVGLQ
jgi:hypothetical protein